MGAVDKSAVSIAIDEYYEAHPIDYSPEGMLARYSGMTKENVIAVVDMVDSYAWLAHYEPSNLYPTPAPAEELPNYMLEDKRYVQSEGILAVVDSGFSEIFRQRNFATA
jgi:hypothetical protein